MTRTIQTANLLLTTRFQPRLMYFLGFWTLVYVCVDRWILRNMYRTSLPLIFHIPKPSRSPLHPNFRHCYVLQGTEGAANFGAGKHVFMCDREPFHRSPFPEIVNLDSRVVGQLSPDRQVS